jgi:hypothetical protein
MNLAESSQSKAITYVITLCLILHKNDLHLARRARVELRSIRLPYFLLFRANPHLPLWVRQATAHVTPRRSAHPSFTSTSPILTGLLVRTPLPHLCSPVLFGTCSSPVTRLSRRSTSGEKDSRKPERAPGGRDRLLSVSLIMPYSHAKYFKILYKFPELV